MFYYFRKRKNTTEKQKKKKKICAAYEEGTVTDQHIKSGLHGLSSISCITSSKPGYVIDTSSAL